ncbi:hypothetical protein PABY_21810 [Pyrodictium abyssi]|uniref:N-glycosylase/DNA lyase n=2 Tax=Pyrodictium abyssi TaxID=54256 RepID=A0ABN6ZQZ3_9CREN|nr:hypothetical protein PABY_21810 [Pyrodictium abyssi]
MTMLDESRIAAVASVLRNIPASAVEVIELNDPQYAAIKKLVAVHGDRAVALAVANALISYRLSLPGEKYWLEFADWGSRIPTPSAGKELVEAMKAFLAESRGNRMVVQQKARRLERAAPVLERVLREPGRYRDLGVLVKELAGVLGARPEEKTIVFAAKMAYYAYRALGLEVAGKNEIPVPLDRRMALLTSASGMINSTPDKVFTRYRLDAVRAWQKVSRESGIPALHLDAVVWLPAHGIERNLRRGLEYARDEFARRLVGYSKGIVDWNTARQVAGQIIYRDPYS